MLRVVLDSNVIVAALKSATGASHEILRLVDLGRVEVALSVPLLTEYEDVLARPELEIPLSMPQIDAILDRLCDVAINQRIHFLWRPFLKDPKDDMVFETALASGASTIVTFNLRDFRPIAEFGVQALTPSETLSIL